MEVDPLLEAKLHLLLQLHADPASASEPSEEGNEPFEHVQSAFRMRVIDRTNWSQLACSASKRRRPARVKI